MKNVCSTFGIVAAVALAGTAKATWSIVLTRPATGEVALGSATCLTNIDLRAETPILLTGLGGGTAQALLEPTGATRALIQELLFTATDPDTIIDELDGIDGGHQRRQYGIADVRGRSTTFSGTLANEWKGGVTGEIEGVVYAIQGNILTGEPVVTAAEDAIVAAITADADLAEAMMVGMEAARLLGGDGRCSCDQGPTDCGSPTVPFDVDTTKTADVGYMLLARPGDVDVSIRRWNIEDDSRAIAFNDIDKDGRADVVVAQRQLRNVYVFENTTPLGLAPGQGFADLTERDLLAGTARYNAVVLEDINSDNELDIIAFGNNESADVFFGQGDFAFAPVESQAVIDDVFDAESFDFVPGRTGSEIFAVGRASQVAALYATDGGTLSVIGEVLNLPGQARNAAIGAAPDPVIGIALESTDQLAVVEAGEGGLNVIATIDTTDRPRGIAAGDFNNDDLTDFAIVGFNSGIVEIFTRVPGASPAEFTLQTVETEARAPEMIALDIDDDGDTDLGVSRDDGTARDLQILLNDGAGGFTIAGPRAATQNAPRLFAADITGDGLQDVIGAGDGGVTVATNRGQGPSIEGGLAGGDYFLELNVAFASTLDPDPVITLRDEYNAWRDALAGTPDAVRSQAEPRPSIVDVDDNTFTLDVLALDVDSNVATINPSDVSVTIDAAFPQVAEMIDAQPIDGGVRLTLATTGALGTAPLNVQLASIDAPSAQRSVILLPRPLARIGANIADLSTDGLTDLTDLDAFIVAFLAGESLADLTGDGMVDMMDIDAFVAAFTNN
ncbi:MAG: DUF1028 domain-containing protein [Planctomycetota bacterium]